MSESGFMSWNDLVFSTIQVLELSADEQAKALSGLRQIAADGGVVMDSCSGSTAREWASNFVFYLLRNSAAIEQVSIQLEKSNEMLESLGEQNSILTAAIQAGDANE